MAITPADLRRQRLADLGREPFTDQLDDWLARWSDALAQPDAGKRLSDWMLKHPDRAAQAQAIMARLAGYTEKLEIRSSAASLDAMSDAELEQEVSRRFGLPIDQLRAMAAKPVLPIAPAVITASGEWASGAEAT